LDLFEICPDSYRDVFLSFLADTKYEIKNFAISILLFLILNIINFDCAHLGLNFTNILVPRVLRPAYAVEALGRCKQLNYSPNGA
jgi:hypothetical protein